MKALVLAVLAVVAEGQGPFGPPPPAPAQGMQTLLAPSDAEANARFGYDVAVAGSVCVVGAFGSHGGNAGTGAAYIFRKDDKGSWAQEYELLPDALQPGDYLGRAVAIAGTTHGDVAVACAPRANVGAGECYLFRKAVRGADWNVEATLTPSDPSQDFGSAVAIAGDTIVIGAQNAAYVFAHRSGRLPWPQQAKLVAPNGEAGFGASVAATASSGAETDLLVVGAPGVGVFSYRYATMRGQVRQSTVLFLHFLHENDHFTKTGSGQTEEKLQKGTVFSQTGPTWTLEGAALLPESGRPSALFGSSVALSGTLLAVSAYDEDNNAGAAYMFARLRGARWGAPQRVTAPDGTPGDRFAYDVAIDGGATHVFKKETPEFAKTGSGHIAKRAFND